MKTKVMIVVGARPNFMKVAPITGAIDDYNERALRASLGTTNADESDVIHRILVHTGQHYSASMSDAFFEDLRLPLPDVHLGVGSGTHAEQTAEIMRRFESVLLRESPDIVVVVGDVNSTLACALVTAKITLDSEGRRPFVAHVEAGLRSFDPSMPEEVNRILTDHLSDLLFVTEESAIDNLVSEGISPEKIHFVGNTMIDSLVACRARAKSSTVLYDLGLRRGGAGCDSHRVVKPYALLTLHRPSNVDNRDAFLKILHGLNDLKNNCAIVFPAHPRTQKRIVEFGLQDYFERLPVADKAGSFTLESTSERIHLIEPLRYLNFLCLMSNARLVITDSGGIQEETTCLGVPCVTVRENTERPVTIAIGTNVLAGTTTSGIQSAIQRQLKSTTVAVTPPLWDGKAAIRILDVIARECRARKNGLSVTSPAVSCNSVAATL